MWKKDKSKKKYVIVPGKLHPSQINELTMCCFFVKSNKLNDLLMFIVNNGGRVISAITSTGVSKNAIIDFFDGYTPNGFFVLSMCQKEIADIFMRNICKELEFNKMGNGKAFMIDILGYMGAKGPFVE